MARIFYSLAGEGRGHAARARTLVESLKREHEVVLFAPDDAYDFLARFYGDSVTDSERKTDSDIPLESGLSSGSGPHAAFVNTAFVHNSSENNTDTAAAANARVRLTRIPGIRFHYTERRLDLLKTISSGLYYAGRELPRLVRAFRQRILAERPDVVITDFEPALPRAAVAEGIPTIAIDHQHVLRAYDLHQLPSRLQWHAWSMSWAVWAYYPQLTEIVTSSFYTLPRKAGWEHVQQVGPLIRPEVSRLQPTLGGYLLSYLRSNTPDTVLGLLEQLDRPIKIYGLGTQPPRGQLTFLPIHEVQFAEDLAACDGVICAAGNQLLGESLFLGKPVFAVPESQHHEQCINASYLKLMGVGDWSTLEDLELPALRDFLERLPALRQQLRDYSGNLNGTQAALDMIQQVIARTTAGEPANSSQVSSRNCQRRTATGVVSEDQIAQKTPCPPLTLSARNVDDRRASGVE